MIYLLYKVKYGTNVNIFYGEVNMVNKYFIFDIIVILLFIIFIVIKVLVRMHKLRADEAADKLKDMQDDLMKEE